MTTFYSETLTCQNCGETSEHHRLGSTNQFGSVDLDTRPQEMARSTLHAQIQACPHCKYCAVDISETAVDVSGCVSSEPYQHQFKSPEYPPLANAYLCLALIQEGVRNFSAAGWGAIKAAWVSDDAKNRMAAKRSRIRAIELIRKAVSAGEDFCEESGVGDAILVDLLRRSGQFEEATKQIELGLIEEPEEILRQVFEFERDLVAKGEVERHTLQEVLDGGKNLINQSKTLPPTKTPQTQNVRPLRIVMMNSESGPLRTCEIIFRNWYPDAGLVLFQDSNEAWQELSQRDPDLLLTGTWFPRVKGKEIVERLAKKKVSYPIIVMSAYEPEELWVREHATRGLNIGFLSMPFAVAALQKLLEGSLKMPRNAIERPVEPPSRSLGTQPPRIVVIDDEDAYLQLVELLIRNCLKEVTLLMFQNRDEAWQELLRADPDLLITDMRSDNIPGRTEDFGMSGFELLVLLRERKVTYPILAISGSFSMSGIEGWAKQQAGPDLRIAFLTKPFTHELFCQTLLRFLGPAAQH